MAKRATSESKKPAVESKEKIAAVSPVRKTVAPRNPVKKAADIASAPPITYERIAERAYYIAMSGNGGSESDNWFRAEAELKGEQGV